MTRGADDACGAADADDQADDEALCACDTYYTDDARPLCCDMGCDCDSDCDAGYDACVGDGGWS